MNFLRFRKRGSVFDSLFIFIALFALIVGGFTAYLILDQVNTEIQADDDFKGNSKANLQTQTDNFPSMIDNMIFGLMVLLTLAAAVLAFFVDTHPIFFVFGLGALIIFMVVGAAMANAYDDFRDDSTIAGIQANFPLTNFLFNNLVVVILAQGAIILTALFIKRGGG